MITKKNKNLYLISLAIIILISGIYSIQRSVDLYTERQIDTLLASSFEILSKNLNTNIIRDTENKYLEIEVQYPTEGVGSNLIEDKVKNTVYNFKKENTLSKEDQDLIMREDNKYVLNITYKNFNTKNSVTHLLNTYIYTGGAHGGTIMTTDSFKISGEQILLKDILVDEKQSLSQISEIIKKQLFSNNDYKDYLDIDWVNEGTKPILENFENFILEKDKITFIFNQYQIGPYALDIIEIPINKIDLKNIIRIEYL